MKKKRLTFFVFFSVIAVGSVALLITSALWINSIFAKYEGDSVKIQDYHINRVKNELKNRVDTIVSFINYRRETTESLLKDELKNRVYELNNLVNHIYKQNKDQLTTNQLTSLIKETVRGLRYNHGRGYYFIDTLQGDVILYPIAPQSEGKNLYDLKDIRGNYAIRQEIDLVNKQNQGFIEGYWIKPGEKGKEFKKITYVQKFAPLGWYFGTGEYVDVVEKEIQEELKSYVNQLSYGESNEQYVFIHSYQGTELANGQFPNLINNNYLNLQDEKGEFVYKDQIELAKQPPHYGFLTHHWPTSNKEHSIQREKLTYIAAIPGWQWVVGSGANMTALKEAILKNQQELSEQLQSSLIKICLIIIGIFAISLLIAKIMSSHINNSIGFFTKHLTSSSETLIPIDTNKVIYKEFEVLANVSNRTTKRINNLLHRDGLTKLYNRRYIDTVLLPLILESLHNEHWISVIMFDIDFFKKVNDQYGHQVGDTVLKDVAACIKQELRNGDYAGRFGGEEILVILPNTTPEAAFAIAERIRQKVVQLSFPELQHHSLTISGGISSQNNHGAVDMIKEADSNLYKAKELGRDRIVTNDDPHK